MTIKNGRVVGWKFTGTDAADTVTVEIPDILVPDALGTLAR